MEQKKYINMYNVVYYLSQSDDELVERLYKPTHLRTWSLVQYNNDVGIEKTFQAIKQNIYGHVLRGKVLNMWIDVFRAKQESPLRRRMPESDIPHFPFAAKVALLILTGRTRKHFRKINISYHS